MGLHGASSFVSVLLGAVACAGTQQGATTASGERLSAAACEAEVAVANPNSYGVFVSVLDRSRRVRLGPVEAYASRTFRFTCPKREFQFILDVGDPGILPVDAATGRVPCWLTDKSTVTNDETLTLAVPGGLEGRLGSGLCPPAR